MPLAGGGLLIGIAVGRTSLGSGSLLMAVMLLVSEIPVLPLVDSNLLRATILRGATGFARLRPEGAH